MAGGGQGMMGGAMGNIISQMKGATQPSQSTVGYTPVTPSVYNNAFNSQQSAQAPQTSVSPIVQQMAQRIQAQNTPFNSGLQSLYNRFNIPQPMMAPRAPVQMPVYQNPALAYRPNIQAVQQNLSRVKPSVYKTDLDAARARIAELETAQQAQQDNSYYNYSGG